MRDFYIYGFRTRDDFSIKSLRSYDNEKRRIESYLYDIMSFRQDENGKRVFISVDCASINTNPLYRAFKTKSFTKNDITLHFIILDILTEHSALSIPQIADIIFDEYLSIFQEPIIFDLSTIRNKLKEYEKIGILTSEKHGKNLLYSMLRDDIDINNYCDAITFFAESSPMGVVGSFLLDKCKSIQKCLSYKHHYIMNALDSEIIEVILQAIHSKRKIEITNFISKTQREEIVIVTPLKFLISVQGGRQYIACKQQRTNIIKNYRLDYIKKVDILDKDEFFDDNYKKLEVILANTWGVNIGNTKDLEKIVLTLSILQNEKYIVNRLLREGRGGKVTQIDDTTYTYEKELYNAQEALPFIRTFIGRIIKFECTNENVKNTFYEDLEEMQKMYEE